MQKTAAMIFLIVKKKTAAMTSVLEQRWCFRWGYSWPGRTKLSQTKWEKGPMQEKYMWYFYFPWLIFWGDGGQRTLIIIWTKPYKCCPRKWYANVVTCGDGHEVRDEHCYLRSSCSYKFDRVCLLTVCTVECACAVKVKLIYSAS